MSVGAVYKIARALFASQTLDQAALQKLTGLSNRSVRYAIDKLKTDGLVRELVDFKDVRKKRYALR